MNAFPNLVNEDYTAANKDEDSLIRYDLDSSVYHYMNTRLERRFHMYFGNNEMHYKAGILGREGK